MKKALFLFALTVASSNAAVTLGGAALTSIKLSSNSATNIPTGSLVLLVVDSGDGFFNFGNSVPAGTTYTSSNDPSLTPTNANLSAGQTFGGEYILGRVASGAGSVSSVLTNVSVASYLNKPFALVWLEGLTATGTETNAPAGTKWGVARGSDWVFPNSDSGTFTSSGTDVAGATSYYQINMATPASGSDNFRTMANSTGSAAFTVVPEPSAALLGAIGALGLLRRRRN